MRGGYEKKGAHIVRSFLLSLSTVSVVLCVVGLVIVYIGRNKM